jgi:menaquinone-specific isochorismate synthase
MTSRMPALRSRTVSLDGVPDLIAEAGEEGYLWREEGAGLAAVGVAAKIELPGGLADTAGSTEVLEALAAIDSDDEVGLAGCGPVAMGALPFDPASPGHLVVPRRVVGYRDGRAWVTTVETAGATGPSDSHIAPVRSSGSPPDHFTLVSSVPHADWKAVVAGAVDAIKRGELRKVVLARRVDITANRPFVITDVLSRLEALYPSCMVFSMEGFLGASPELLMRRSGAEIESHPLAGTVARSGDTRSDDALVAGLLGSEKARHEHQVVVDELRAALDPVCASLDVPAQPSVMGLRNVSHLATRITGRLASTAARLPSALELVGLVHPTPAVAGNPTGAAIRYAAEVEGFDRGRYAGPVGWMDSRGDGAFALGIRCAETSGARARIYAGNGVVAGSDPGEELAETQLKLQALLAALVRP